MLIDARNLESDSILDADVCVVGAGAAGITVALELAESGLSTVLLESGGQTGPDPDTQALYKGSSTGQPFQSLFNPVTIPLDIVRLRWLGGTTNHWAGYCRKLEPIDFEQRPHLAVSGWPIGSADLHDYWNRAARWCRITDAEDDAQIWADRLSAPSPLSSSAAVHSRAFQVTPIMRFGDEYRPDLSFTEGVTVVLWANVVNLATTDGRHIEAAQARTLTGNSLTVRARGFVLACGGLENPRLLLASTDADPSGIGNQHDQVGRHFAEHLQVAGGFGVVDATPDELAGYLGVQATITQGPWAGHEHGVKYALALTSDHVRSNNTLGLESQLLVGSLPDGGPVQQAGVDAKAAADLMAFSTKKAPASSLYLQVLAEQALDPQSRVTLGSATDALGMRRIRLHWRYNSSDKAAVVSGLRTMAAELGALGLGRLQVLPGAVTFGRPDFDPVELINFYGSDPDDIDPTDFPVGVGFHHMCTTRMSADPHSGVVDADCRVHEVDNLWIGGSSVFATGGVATPTFTIVALAVRLADHLREVLP